MAQIINDLKRFELVIILFVCFSCHKDTQTDITPVSKNKINIEVNGTMWDSKNANGILFTSKSFAYTCTYAIKTYKNFLLFSFQRYYSNQDEKNVLIESIHLFAIPFRVGSHALNGKELTACNPDTIPSIRYITNSYDVIMDEYIANPKTNNIVKITKADTLNRYVEGSIEATMYRIRKDGDNLYPDTLHIKNSTFSLHIE